MLLHDKNSEKIELEGNFNLKTYVYKKLTDNIIINGERLNALSLISGTNKNHPLSWFLFNTVMKILSRAIRKGNKNRLERKKTDPICRWHGCLKQSPREVWSVTGKTEKLDFIKMYSMEDC